MTVSVSLRFPGKSTGRTEERVFADETTVAVLTEAAIRSYERNEGAHFSGAHFVTLVNGCPAQPQDIVRDGDDVKILVVASGG